MNYQIKIISAICTTLFFISCSDKEDHSLNKNYETDMEVSYNGNVYKIIEYNGLKWLDRNLGAKVTCASPKGGAECLGNLYQWGRIEDGHEKLNSPISEKQIVNCNNISNGSFIVNTIEGDLRSDEIIAKYANQTWFNSCNIEQLWNENGNGFNEICPTGWHVATKQDFESLHAANAKDAYDKVKLVLSGSRLALRRKHIKPEIVNRNIIGEYWTSSISRNHPISFIFSANNKPIFSESQVVTGKAVRCVKNVQTSY